jgi:RNA polymerase sigma factor (sigma-70 family)
MSIFNEHTELKALKYFQNDDFGKCFEILIDIYSKPLYAHINKMLQNHNDTDDVLQNTFLKAWKYLKSFKQEAKFGTWLFRIATNETLTFIEKRKKLFTNSEEISADSIFTNHHENNSAEEITLALDNCISLLPAKQKQIFILRYFDEMNYREMSEVLQTSEGALKASYHLAVKKITEILKSD